MPPSPALRFSPTRELRGGNHKRGPSLGSGVVFQEKDDELELFKEMENREKEDFLLQSSDDFEGTFSAKLKHFSNPTLGISVPVRGESSELLTADGDKNDYDWLLTPPETPLFPSLDDEPPPVTAASRSRARSQPISISRSSTMEKSNRSSRGSASPNHLSPSPRSGNSTFQSRARPSSAPNSSPKPSLRPTPTRRSSPPPHKPSNYVPRSSTPTSRRTSTGSNTLDSSEVRGTSPVRIDRGNSASPKIMAWQSNFPGFLIDTPPNLRTSLADRPASYVRGSSPASRSSRDSATRYHRQSISPTPSRSVGSSHSHDRDQFSCQSKGSVASSMDDDSDSLQSGPVGGSECSFAKRVGSVPSNRSLGFSKKPSRVLSSGSAPKRSSDSAIRRMDHQKTPQNMFRPLLSSAPSTTFYIGKGSSHRPIFSRNSSMTTSSNASSDQFTSFAPYTGGAAHHQDGLAECKKEQYPDIQGGVFASDKIDRSSEDSGFANHNGSLDIRHGDFDTANICGPSFAENSSCHIIDTEVVSSSEVLLARGGFSELGNLQNVQICSNCRTQYHFVETVEVGNNLCPDCREQHDFVTIAIPDTRTIVPHTPSKPSVKKSEEYKSLNEMNLPVPVSELVLRSSNQLEPVTRDVENFKQEQTLHNQDIQSHLQEFSNAVPSADEGGDRLNSQHETGPPSLSHRIQDMELQGQQLVLFDEHPDVQADSSEGAGISVLLKRSSSVKGPVVQGRVFIASPKPYENLSYTREIANSSRSSAGYDSVSASSSTDYGAARQAGTLLQRQFSDKRPDMENNRSGLTSIPLSNIAGVSNHDQVALNLTTVTPEEYYKVPVVEVGWHERKGKDHQSSHVPPLEDKETAVTNSSFTDEATCEGKTNSNNPSALELSRITLSIQLEDDSVSSVQISENGISHENREDREDAQAIVYSRETSHITLESLGEEHSTLNNDVAEVPGHCSLSRISEIEVENSFQESSDLQTRDGSPTLKSYSNGLHELPSPESMDEDPEPNSLDRPHEISDESVESRGGNKAKSLTFEEATDTILFCKSIVHDIAYRAATIAIDKENEESPGEVSWPTVMILGKSSNTNRTVPRGRTVSSRASKSIKATQTQTEEVEKAPPSKIDENAGEAVTRNVGIPNKAEGMKPPKLESKCNCRIM